MPAKTTKPTASPAAPDAATTAPAAPSAPPTRAATPAPTNSTGAPLPLAIGQIVHYVLPGGTTPGECRPAIIVRVGDPPTGTVNLAVITDGDSDGRVPLGQLWWRPNIAYAETPAPDTWHWPDAD